MLCAAIMAVQAGGATHAQFQGFAIAYAALRAGLVLQYLRVWRHDPASRAVSGWLAGVFTIRRSARGARRLSWGRSGRGRCGRSRSRWTWWDRGSASARMRRAPVHPTHLPERFALFTLIFLGESLAAEVRGLAAADLRLPSVVIGVFAFVIASCLWWLYFDHFGALRHR
jgi:low temperature requirement protein LtrA